MSKRIIKICIVLALCISLILGCYVPSQAIVLETAAVYGLGCLVVGLLGISLYAVSNTTSNWNGLLRTIFGPDYTKISREVKYVESTDTLVIPAPTYNEIVADVNSFVVSVDRKPCAIYGGHIAFFAHRGQALNVRDYFYGQGTWRYNYAPDDGYYYSQYSASNVHTATAVVPDVGSFEYTYASDLKTYQLSPYGATQLTNFVYAVIEYPMEYPPRELAHAPLYESYQGTIPAPEPPVYVDIPSLYAPAPLVDTTVYPAVTVNMTAVADAVGAPPDTNLEDLLGDLCVVPPDAVAPSLDAVDFVPVDNESYQDIAVTGTYDIVNSWDNPTEEPDTGSGSIFARILAWLIALYHALVEWFQTLGNNLWAKFDSVLQWLRDLYARLGSILTILAHDAVDFLGDLPRYMSSLGDVLENIWGYVHTWVSSLGEWILALGTIWGFLPTEMVIPVYATLIIVIVVGLWRRWLD